MTDISPPNHVTVDIDEIIWTEQDVRLAKEYLDRGFALFRKVNRNEMLCVVQDTRLFDYPQSPTSFLATVSYNCYTMSLKVRVGGENISYEERIDLRNCNDWIDVRFMAEEMVARQIAAAIQARPSRPDPEADKSWLDSLANFDGYEEDGPPFGGPSLPSSIFPDGSVE